MSELLIAMQDYKEIKDKINVLNGEKEEVETRLYLLAMQEDSELADRLEGSKSYDIEGKKLTITKKLTYKVDEKLLDDLASFASKRITETSGYRLIDLDAVRSLVSLKVEYSKTNAKKLAPDEIEFLNRYVTTKDAKPSFEVKL